MEPTPSGEERVAISFNLRGKWRHTSSATVFLGHGLGRGAGAGAEGLDRYTPGEELPEPFAFKVEDSRLLVGTNTV